jgi:hypothetical protein
MQWVEPGAVRAYLLLMVEHSWVTVTVTAWRIVNLECAGLACAGRTGTCTETSDLSSRDCLQVRVRRCWMGSGTAGYR